MKATNAFRSRLLFATIVLGIMAWGAAAQTTQPPLAVSVAGMPAETNFTLWIAIAGIALLVGGFFYLKKHGNALSGLTDALHRNTAATGANTQMAAAAPATGTAPLVMGSAMTPAEVRAAIAAAVAAARVGSPVGAAAGVVAPASPPAPAASPAAPPTLPATPKRPDTTIDPVPMSSGGGDETPIAWAARTAAVPAAELLAFNAFAHQFPATTTYADVLTAYRAAQGGGGAQQVGPRPGTAVVDVGGQTADQGAYRGTVNPAMLTLGNWAYYQQHALGNRAGDIFDRPPVIGNMSIGADHRWTQGDLANATPDPVLSDGSGVSLSQFG